MTKQRRVQETDEIVDSDPRAEEPAQRAAGAENATGGAGASATGTDPDQPAAGQVESPTELRNPRTTDIDTVSTLEMLRQINAEDADVPGAVAGVLPDVARAVDAAVDALRAGRSIHYFGAGTSGRLGAMDAAELPPTYGIEPDAVVAHQAGGAATLDRAVEGAEDDERSGADDAAGLRRGDVALGLAASGRTPYVVGALHAARNAGATTALIGSNPHASLGDDVDVHIAVPTGAEVVAGSTRMKAGTAQKLVLNAFSTAVMVRLGRTYSNLMVGMLAKNTKLRGRTVTILVEASGRDTETCASVLEEAGGDPRVALVALLSGAPVGGADAAIAASDGSVRDALRIVGADGTGP